jgi:hypothetical protein
MKFLSAVADPLEAALPVIGQMSFPGMSADEVDAFTLGYYAGAMAYEVISTGEATSAAKVAELLETEIKRIQSDDGAI